MNSFDLIAGNPVVRRAVSGLAFCASLCLSSASLALINTYTNDSGQPGGTTVDNGVAPGSSPQDFSVTVPSSDFPAGSMVIEVSLSVQFEKSSNTCGNDNGGNTFNNEISMVLTNDNTGTSVSVVAFNQYSGGAYGGVVTVNFDDDNASPVSGTPTAGNFQPNTSFSGFDGESPSSSPADTWTLTLADSAGQDPLCFYEYTLTIETDDVDQLVEDFVVTNYDLTAVFDVANNDFGTTTQICLDDPNVAGNQCLNTVTIPGQGVFTVTDTSEVTFDPDPTYSGIVTPVTYFESASPGVGGAVIEVVINERSLCTADGTVDPFVMGNPAGTNNLVVFQVDDGSGTQTGPSQIELDHNAVNVAEGVGTVNQINSFGLDTARNFAFYQDNSQTVNGGATVGGRGRLYMFDANTDDVYEIIGPNAAGSFDDFTDVGVQSCGTELGGAAGEYFAGSYYFGIEEDANDCGGPDDGETFDRLYRLDFDYNFFPPRPIAPATLIWRFDPANTGGVGSGTGHDWGDILIQPTDPDNTPGTGDERLVLIDIDRNSGAGSDFVTRVDITDPDNPTFIDITPVAANTLGQGAISFDNTVYVFLASGDEIAVYDQDTGVVGPPIEIVNTDSQGNPGWPAGAAAIDGSSCVDPSGGLPVTLNYIESRQSGSNLKLKWQTASETFTVGFNLWGEVAGEWVQLNNKLVRTRKLESVVPQTYRKSVSTRDLDGELGAIALTSVDLNGYEEGFGPFEIGERYGEETEFEPVPWDSIQAEYSARMEERGYVKVNQRWRRLTSGLERRLIRASEKVEMLAHIGVEENGMVRLTYEELLNAGVDFSDVRKRDLALTFKGRAVARHVGGSGSRFGPGAWLDFYGEAPKGEDALYISENLYQLGVDRDRALAASRVNRRPGDSPLTWLDSIVVENDTAYSNILPTGDPFYMQFMFAGGGNGATYPNPAQPGFPIEVPADIDLSQPAWVEFNIGALSNPPEEDVNNDGNPDPDHVIRILVNDQEATLDNPTFEGYGQWQVRGTLPAGVVQPGANSLRIEMLPSGYTQTELLTLDSYALHVPRALDASADTVDQISIGDVLGSLEQEAAAELIDGYDIAGFSTRQLAAYAYHASGGDYAGNLVRLRTRTKKQSDDTYTASIPTLGAVGTGYWVSAGDALGTPSSIEPIAQVHEPGDVLGQQALLEKAGDYILIVHKNFLPPVDDVPDHPLNRYLEAKQTEGYNPVVIDLDEIIETWGYGMNVPAAITRYLAAADEAFSYDHVLLVGGDVYDYLNKLGQGAISFIPTRYAVTQGRLQYTPSDALTVDFDGDEVADKALGRWPVRTQAELESIVDKTLAYSDAGSGQFDDRTALLIAEEFSNQEGFDFTAQMQRINYRLQSLDAFGNGERWDANDVYAQSGANNSTNAVDQVFVEDLIADPAIAVADVNSTARQLIVDGINQIGGQTLTVFAGHGAPGNWSFSNLMTPAIANNDLNNAGTPTLMMPMACYTTYYNTPDTNTLAHQLMLAGDKGAVAIHAAATLSSYSDNESLGTRALEHQLRDGDTLGQAIEKARRAIKSRDVQINWTLLGDPTIRIE